LEASILDKVFSEDSSGHWDPELLQLQDQPPAQFPNPDLGK